MKITPTAEMLIPLTLAVTANARIAPMAIMKRLNPSAGMSRSFPRVSSTTEERPALHLCCRTGGALDQQRDMDAGSQLRDITNRLEDGC